MFGPFEYYCLVVAFVTVQKLWGEGGITEAGGRENVKKWPFWPKMAPFWGFLGETVFALTR